jgi:hypothetical protein
MCEINTSHHRHDKLGLLMLTLHRNILSKNAGSQVQGFPSCALSQPSKFWVVRDNWVTAITRCTPIYAFKCWIAFGVCLTACLWTLDYVYCLYANLQHAQRKHCVYINTPADQEKCCMDICVDLWRASALTRDMSTVLGMLTEFI